MMIRIILIFYMEGQLPTTNLSRGITMPQVNLSHRVKFLSNKSHPPNKNIELGILLLKKRIS